MLHVCLIPGLLIFTSPDIAFHKSFVLVVYDLVYQVQIYQ